MAGDRYPEYYAAKLWQLMPAVYRALDSTPGTPGPLHEIVNRIGGQAAVLRRSIDRLWEDQSIESCDDWIIPYIADLLATRLVACLDARANRLDVAKTIYYRRRKGTVGLLEELASDIAGHDARVVEFFRRLGRTRHNFDPPIGLVPITSVGSEVSLAPPIAPPPAPIVEGLSGVYTHTPMGGFADLRHRYGGTKAHTAFDEFFHTADFRLGRQTVGWHGIPKLGVFVWWLQTYRVPPTTPVQYAACTLIPQFTFDPTGREMPLFAATRRSSDEFGEAWTSPEEWELPTPIEQALFDMRPDMLYGDALSVQEGNTSPYPLVALSNISINVERGRFHTSYAPSGGQFHVQYHYGFGSDIGAGTYDQRYGGGSQTDPIAPVNAVIGGGSNLAAAVATQPATGSIVISDSLTYALPGPLNPGSSGIVAVAVLGKNKERPVIRAVAGVRPSWEIEGAPGATLALEGIHLVGTDLVLTGEFKSVKLRCATLDPGTSGAALQPPSIFAPAADNQALWPTRLFVEGSIAELTIERCVTGPIRTRNGGAIQTLTVCDSIVQAIAETGGGAFTADDLYDADALIKRLALAPDPLAQFLRTQLSTSLLNDIDNYISPPGAPLVQLLATELNGLLSTTIYSAARFAHIHLSAATLALASLPLTGAALAAFNRQLLIETFPIELACLALATSVGKVALQRSTILGPCAVHRLDASECILDDVAVAEDAQDGCIRFSAYAAGSVLHQPYESVSIAPLSPIFVTRDFGRPDYARLLDTADDAIVTGRDGASIVAGAENGAEMGAFSRELVTLKRRGLAQKFAEYMPVAMVPVWIDVT